MAERKWVLEATAYAALMVSAHFGHAEALSLHTPATANPNQERQLDKLPELIPSSVVIPSLGISEQVAIAAPEFGSQGLTGWKTADSGICTIQDDFNQLKDTSLLFAHSRMKGVDQVFKDLQDVEIGTPVYINGTERPGDIYRENIKFEVERLIITDMDRAALIIFHQNDQDPRRRLVMQTSLKESQKTDAILDMGKLIHKPGIEVLIPGNYDAPEPYYLLLAIGHQVPN